MTTNVETRRRKLDTDKQDSPEDHDGAHQPGSCCDGVCVAHVHSEASDAHSCLLQTSSSCTPKHPQRTCSFVDEIRDENPRKTTISAENEVEAQKLANNYKFGFRKWKSHVTERPFEDRSNIVKELYSELNVIKPYSVGSLFTCGNVLYVFLFGWWIALVYVLVGLLMFLTVFGIPYAKLCWKLSCYFLWPFGKSIEKASVSVAAYSVKILQDNSNLEAEEDGKPSSPLLLPTPVGETIEEPTERPQNDHYWWRVSTYIWLLVGYPLLAITHSVLCLISWMLVFTIPVAKMSTKTLHTILLIPPEHVHISQATETQEHESRVILCCYHAVNLYYYKYTVDGINVFAVNLLLLVIVSLVIGYVDKSNEFVSSEVKFATAVSSIIPLSYYIGMGIASISAQSNFAVGAVVNATFGSITELTFYITALVRGHHQGNKCLQEIVKAALTGTLLGCILFIPGICMIIGGLRHSEQRFNSRSAGVSSSLLFISVGGVFAPTLFSKAYGNLVCEDCTNSTGTNSSGSFTCKNCHYDLSENSYSLFHSHIEPLVYTISILLPVSYIIGLIFTLKTHSHIYDIHVGDGTGHLGASVHWSRWRALLILIVATVLMSACADLTTEHIQPILSHSSISQYFIGVTVLAMVPEIPEIVNGVQFALQNTISLSFEVGSCIAVQVCMIQIPILVLFNIFYDVGFVLIFSDLHLWASIFSVIVVNYIFMDGKSDYFQGTALVVVYLILLALYYFAPSPSGC
ncbi:low affinity vacuolar monovalent cation/H(+) antiporter [Cyprinus carpio]|uniref:Low affinity vacuolar monovalent cation/H(+) antiporter n=1 Tax=Cyprinus carpio TaxID=7962 RepID=A0A9Q9VV77_CYPCA|nr:low affinity vacuolar monovalent cation/H(+) antiporter [Cyprinus carpio]